MIEIYKAIQDRIMAVSGMDAGVTIEDVKQGFEKMSQEERVTEINYLSDNGYLKGGKQ